MEEQLAKELLQKYREGRLTDEEKAILESWYVEFAKSREQVPIAGDSLQQELDEIRQGITGRPGVRKFPVRMFRWAAAASVVLFGLLGTYLYIRDAAPQPRGIAADAADFSPGTNRAVLLLADGVRIELDQARVGNLAKEGNTAIRKTGDGEIVYMAEASAPGNGAAGFNQVSTPGAGQYRVKLPDGTQVWLNALSSIRFPTVFDKNGREVEITGEVYFEVAKQIRGNRRVPFRVKSGNQVIEVLGTHFNVNSYGDEGLIKTTLLEGSIQVHLRQEREKGMLLKPGQQVWVNTGKGRSFIVKEVDTQSVVAWKDGYFRFDGVSLKELMRQISRWYGVEVVYEGPVKEYEFVGQIERNANLSKVLKILELGDVRFRIEGKKIIITE